jgi:hypothetical protein
MPTADRLNNAEQADGFIAVLSPAGVPVKNSVCGSTAGTLTDYAGSIVDRDGLYAPSMNC